MPNNSASTGLVADAHLSFKVSQPLKKGTLVTIKAASNLSAAHSTGSIMNECFSKVRYQSCEVQTGGLQLVIDEDVAALSAIELYVV